MPYLTKMAEENISFSDSEKLGGFRSVSGTTWTVGALMATTSGIPFSFLVEGNDMNLRETFASNLTNLGDILEKFDYNQYFLCGSDAEFGGRKTYFQEHGDYEIIDLFKAREKGYIPSDYYAWWGYEDKYLFDIAKKELTQISRDDEPFNFTMLTVDTHHVDGYVCSLCENKYPVQTANVVSCSDKQIKEFVDWCKLQDFYKDTAIVLIGNHPRMDNSLVENVEYFDRTMYNCFINCEEYDNLNTRNRVFTSLDIFPTLLSAVGFEYEGDRIGLGTDMFSNTPTLAEEIGLDTLHNEIAKKSDYYIRKFS